MTIKLEQLQREIGVSKLTEILDSQGLQAKLQYADNDPDLVKIRTAHAAMGNGKTKRTTKRKTEENSGQAAGALAQFVDRMSETASDQVADLTTAVTLQKAAKKLATGKFGRLTQKVMDSIETGFIETLEAELIALEGEEEDFPKLLTSVDDTSFRSSSLQNSSDGDSESN